MPFLQSQFIAACRWVGALLVLAIHANNVLVNLADIMSAPHSAGVYAWWFVVGYGFGHQAVVGFFVISGYLVGGVVLARLREHRPFLRDYLIHRFARIYVVLAPAVALSAALDGAGRAFFSGSGVYDWPAFADHYGAGLFFGALANLTVIYSGVFGTNGPLWTLACEFWYYLSFPLLLLPFSRAYAPRLRAAGFAFGLVLVIVLSLPHSWFGFGYLLWALGAAATLATRPLLRSRWLALAAYVVAIIPIRLLVRGPILDAHPILQDAADILGALLFVNLLVTLRFAPQEGWSLLRSRLHERFADFSFSLYVTHTPLLILGCAALDTLGGVGWAHRLATPVHWAAMAAMIGLCILLGYAFSRVTEAHTNAARRKLRAALEAIAARGARAGAAAPAE